MTAACSTSACTGRPFIWSNKTTPQCRDDRQLRGCLTTQTSTAYAYTPPPVPVHRLRDLVKDPSEQGLNGSSMLGFPRNRAVMDRCPPAKNCCASTACG